MLLNTARMLNEAIQSAIKGLKVLVSCTTVFQGQELAGRVIAATASVYLLYDQPQLCTHSPMGVGWSVRYLKGGEIFFCNAEPSQSDYFDLFLVFAPYAEVRAELVAKGQDPQLVPFTWVFDTSLVRKPVYVPTRYERILVNL
jgi:hypothetical protein